MKIYIECGTTARSSANTGIQRVVRNIVREAPAVSKAFGFEVIPIAFVGDGFVAASLDLSLIQPSHAKGSKIRQLLGRSYRLLSKVLGVRLHDHLKRVAKRLLSTGKRVEKIRLVPAEANAQPSVLLLLDSTWDDAIWTHVDAFRAQGGVVCAVLYDLIPFTHPETVAEQTRLVHTTWWRKAPRHIDAVLCISRSVRQEFLDWQQREECSVKIPASQVGYFYLGAELDKSDPVIQILTDRTPFFIAVGSIEPRKNYETILDAFELLWAQGIVAQLVIVGGFGWKNEKLLARIQAHPQLHQLLFLIRDASDRDLAALYRNASALVLASVAEGFGLPIVEAQQYGTAVICSDIPVFRELDNGSTSYFPALDPVMLANCVQEALSSNIYKRDSQSHTDKKQWINWETSTEQLINSMKICLSSQRRINAENLGNTQFESRVF